jgi:Fe-S cluster biogenesis protein NfuA
VTFTADVETVLAELRPLVQGDGADLELAAVDEAAREVTLRLRLDGVECLECVMPPEFLYDIVSGAMREQVDGVRVVLDDPRQRDG